MEMIRCEDLRKTYGSGSSEVHAVDGISLSFEQGTFTAITGKIGSGKSTLLHLLSGRDRPTSGKVFMDGQDVYAQDEENVRYDFQKIVDEASGIFGVKSMVILPAKPTKEELIELVKTARID